MSPKVQLDQVPISQRVIWLGQEGGEVADGVVTGDAGGEGDT